MLIAGIPALAQADEAVSFRKHEFSLGWGVGTAQEYLWLLEDIIVVSITGQELEDATGSGAISVSYRYHPNRRLAFGVTGIFESIEATYSNPDEVRTSNTFALLATGRFNYYDGSKLSVYSGLGWGYCRVFDQNKFIGFQLTALGVNFRLAGAVGLFAELGFGFQGFVSAGLSARL